jgi:hypothetical protein
MKTLFFILLSITVSGNPVPDYWRIARKAKKNTDEQTRARWEKYQRIHGIYKIVKLK